MRRTAVSVLFSLALLLSVTAVSKAVLQAEANPYPWNSEILIESPTNKTYNMDSLVLNVTIATKFDGTYTSSSRRVVNYSLDSQPDIPLEAVNFYYDNESQSSIFVGSTLLAGLTDGSHNLKVQCRYYYEAEVNAGGNTYITQSHYSVAYVNFTIEISPSPVITNSSDSPTTAEPFPWLPLAAVSVAVAAVVAVSAVVYLKKRKSPSARGVV
jgi:hypothetical protein